MPTSPSLIWFDAHLDLAYLAVSGRDMLAPLSRGAGPHPPAAVTLPALAEGGGGVRFALATIFTEPDGTGPEGYPAGDVERAARVGRAQLEVYRTWSDRAVIRLDLARALRIDRAVGAIRGGMGVSHVVPESIESRAAKVADPSCLCAGILIENADPIRSPDELAWWKEQGVAAIGLAWAKSSRYAGGNSTHDGLTDLGRAMVREIDRLGIVHDVSHLSDRAMSELLALTTRPVIASHSNSRVLLGDPQNQRHLTDDAIREITRRGGIIGVNLFSKFLIPGINTRMPPPSGEQRMRASMDHCIAAIEHVCELAGHRRAIGLGSDMDGGFSADALPEGINRPADLHRITDALAQCGWSDDDLDGFRWKNWFRFWSSR